MLTLTQMHETFPIALAHVRTRNTSENLLANYSIQMKLLKKYITIF